VSDEETPIWRYLVPGLLMLGLAGVTLVTGEVPVDKARTITITRTGSPVFYWLIVASTGAIGAFALHKVWKRLTS
jgi:hypothetical protein